MDKVEKKRTSNSDSQKSLVLATRLMGWKTVTYRNKEYWARSVNEERPDIYGELKSVWNPFRHRDDASQVIERIRELGSVWIADFLERAKQIGNMEDRDALINWLLVPPKVWAQAAYDLLQEKVTADLMQERVTA